MPERPHDITMAIDKATLDSGRFKKAHASLVVLRGADQASTLAAVQSGGYGTTIARWRA